MAVSVVVSHGLALASRGVLTDHKRHGLRTEIYDRSRSVSCDQTKTHPKVISGSVPTCDAPRTCVCSAFLTPFIFVTGLHLLFYMYASHMKPEN